MSTDSLHQAVRKGNEEEVMRQLEGKDINAYSQSGLTLLHVAATGSNISLTTQLLEKGADPNFPAEKESVYDGYTPVHFACERATSIDILNLFLKQGAADNLKDSLERYPLHIACLKGNVAAVQVLTAKGTNYLETLNAQDVHGRSPLMLACSQGHSNVVRHFLKLPETEIDLIDLNGNTALHHCFQVQSQQLFNYNYPLLDGHYQSAFEMVKAGAKVDIINHDGDASLDVIHDSLAVLLEMLSKERERLQDVESVEALISLEQEELTARNIDPEVSSQLLEAISVYSKVMERELALRKARGSCPFVDANGMGNIRKFKGMDLSQFSRCPAGGEAAEYEAGGIKPDHNQFKEYQSMRPPFAMPFGQSGAPPGVCPMGFVGEKPANHGAPQMEGGGPMDGKMMMTPPLLPSSSSPSPSSPSSFSFNYRSLVVPLSFAFLAASAAFLAQRYLRP